MKVSDLYRYAIARLAGPIPEGISVVDVINEAGEFLVSLWDWNWLLRGPTDLNATATQEYIDLPAAFSKIESIHLSDSSVDRLMPTTPEKLNQLRENFYTATPGLWWFTLLWPLGAVTGLPTPRIELYPTPGSNYTPFCTLIYRSSWVTLTSDDDDIPIPPHMDGLMRAIVQVYAESYTRESAESRQERLHEIRIGPEFDLARQRDGGAINYFGRIRGGHISGQPHIIHGILRSTVLPPS